MLVQSSNGNPYIARGRGESLAPHVEFHVVRDVQAHLHGRFMPKSCSLGGVGRATGPDRAAEGKSLDSPNGPSAMAGEPRIQFAN